MQDSLGGNAKTLMFVNFSPADYNRWVIFGCFLIENDFKCIKYSDETVSSLNYAARVKKITNNVARVRCMKLVFYLFNLLMRCFTS
jgi:hypothetical protein